MNIRIISYGRISSSLKERVERVANIWIPKIVEEFRCETELPFIADVEVHEANWIKRIDKKLKLIFSSGFSYKYNSDLKLLVPTVQLAAAKILTYPYTGLKAIIYHEYFNFLYDCYHGYDEPVKRIWNPRKENAELYYKVYRDLERVFEMALRCFKDEEPLISFLEREIDRTLSMFDKKLKPKVVSGFLEIEEKVFRGIPESIRCEMALTIRPNILITKIFTGSELPNIKEILSKRKLLLEKYLLMNRLFREKAF